MGWNVEKKINLYYKIILFIYYMNKVKIAILISGNINEELNAHKIKAG